MEEIYKSEKLQNEQDEKFCLDCENEDILKNMSKEELCHLVRQAYKSTWRIIKSSD